MADSSDDDNHANEDVKSKKVSAKIKKKDEAVGERDLSDVKNKILRAELYKKQKNGKEQGKKKTKGKKKARQNRKWRRRGSETSPEDS